MGRFSTVVHIKSNSDKRKFIDSFCDAMKKRGFVPCPEECAALSYLLAFSEGGWVTLASEGYGDNSKLAFDDAEQTAIELETSCFSLEIVDSDFAILKLFGGNLSDEVIVGDGSGYGIEEAPKGVGKLWEPLLAENKTREQLSEAWEKSGVFVEDVLCGSAPILGIESKYMIADYGELYDSLESDTNIIPLYFMKKTDDKVKSMSFNSAFIKVFGEGLEPLGFKRLKKLKTKFPYFVRVVNGEILHIVSYRTVTSSKLKHKCIEVLGGVATLYRRNIDFTISPEEWLANPAHLFWRFSELNIEPSFMKKTVQELDAKPMLSTKMIDGKPCWVSQTLEETFRSSISDFHCKTDDSEEMLHDLKNAFNAAKSVLLPVFDNAADLCSCIDYFYKTNQRLAWMDLCDFDEFLTNDRYSFSEGLILIKAGYRDDGIKRTEKEIAEWLKYRDCSPEEENKLRKKYERSRAEQAAFRDKMLDDPELNKRVMEELEQCKANNTKKLKEYGLL